MEQKVKNKFIYEVCGALAEPGHLRPFVGASFGHAKGEFGAMLLKLPSK